MGVTQAVRGRDGQAVDRKRSFCTWGKRREARLTGVGRTDTQSTGIGIGKSVVAENIKLDR